MKHCKQNFFSSINFGAALIFISHWSRVKAPKEKDLPTGKNLQKEADFFKTQFIVQKEIVFVLSSLYVEDVTCQLRDRTRKLWHIKRRMT